MFAETVASDGRVRRRLIGLFAAVAVSPALAQQPTPAQASAIKQSCRGDYMRYCSGVPAGGLASLQCLEQNASRASSACQAALNAVAGSTPPSATPASYAPPRAAASPAVKPVPRGQAQWPHTVTGSGGSAVVYQPQAVSWPDRRMLNTRMAIAITPSGAAAPILGTIEVAFRTDSDLATRTVTLFSPQLLSSRFPAADTGQAARFEQRVREHLASLESKRMPLDTILIGLRQEGARVPAVALSNDPPRIFHSEGPASLVVFDGEPVLAPIGSTGLQFAVNTNWDIVYSARMQGWYLLYDGGWLSAPRYDGPWAPAAQIPTAFYDIPADGSFGAMRNAVPGRTIPATDAPQVFVSTLPAEIIVIAGQPRLEPIPGTTIAYVSNTDADLFQDAATGLYYYLVSGRWFSARTLDGPWSYATPTLPPYFALIPPDHPRASVLVSVPGTAQAQQAIIQAQIPQQGTLDRGMARFEAVYSGAPAFAPIVGTELFYATNTPYDVIRVGTAYYACYQGAWFTAPAPTGPWVLATSVPAVIYTIPPASPLYHVTYVQVYGSTATTVTYGYTAGYTMSYVSAGVVVYGTGFYYPPVLIPAPVPVYYPYPYTFAGGVAYNPATGAWAHGGAVYGPYGGAGAFSAYNPSTGSYARGSANWGTGGGTANADWYNAPAGRTGSTNQNWNAYGRWGSSQVAGPNQTVNTASGANAQGAAGGFRSTSGAEGAGFSGAGGNQGGVVKTAGGDVYAGADGNVYRHDSGGWSKYDDGSWNSVTPPSPPNSGNRGAGESSPGSGTPGSGFGQSEPGRQLDQDRLARGEGEAQQQRFGQFRQGGFGEGGGRFGAGARPFGGGFAGRFGGGGFLGRR